MAPTAQSLQVKVKDPSLNYSNNKGDGSLRVRHREYLRDIEPLLANTFQLWTYPINPGLSYLFKWLSNIGSMYESYKFHSLNFVFESSGSTSDRGTVMIAVDYDASDLPPVSKQDLMSYRGAVRSNVWSHCAFIASKDDLIKFGNQRYIRSGTVSGDIKTFDVGNLYIAVQGTAAAATLGEVYVEYDVSFYTPQTSITSLLESQSCTVAFSTVVSLAAPFGVKIDTRRGLLPVEWRSQNSLWIREPGQYLVEVGLLGSGVDSTDTVDLTLHPAGVGQIAVLGFGFMVNNAKTTGRELYRVWVTDTNQYLQIAFVNITTLTQTELRIAPFAYTND